jgi:hypothetical protein
VIATGFDQTHSRSRTARASDESEKPEAVEFDTPSFDTDDIEIPAFLRRRN